MSQYVSTENQELVQVATNLGWSEFCEWVKSLDMEDYPTLFTLVKNGSTDGPDDLLDDLDDAVEEHPPSDDVEDIAERLAEFLGAHQEAEIIVISNGMTEDDGEEGAEEVEGAEA